MIRDILRTGDIKRWGIIKTHRTQNIAEHQYKVAMLAETFARLAIEDYKNGDILMTALTHDISEVQHGDIPTPTKRLISKHFDVDINKILDLDFWVSREEHSTWFPEIKDEYLQIIKLADLAEAVFFLYEEGYGKRANGVRLKLLGNFVMVASQIKRVDPNVFIYRCVRLVYKELGLKEKRSWPREKKRRKGLIERAEAL